MSDRHNRQTEQKLKTALKWKLQVGGQHLLREAPQWPECTPVPPVKQILPPEGTDSDKRRVSVGSKEAESEEETAPLLCR